MTNLLDKARALEEQLTEDRVAELANRDTPWHRWSSVVEVRAMAAELQTLRSQSTLRDCVRRLEADNLKALAEYDEAIAGRDAALVRVKELEVEVAAMRPVVEAAEKEIANFPTHKMWLLVLIRSAVDAYRARKP